MAKVVEIDGSLMEGGGQVLRVASALAALSRRRCRISKIRAGRSTPGLRPQHLTSLNLVANIGDASLEGCAVGSTEVTMTPSAESPLKALYEADAGTAGAVSLMIQAALPVLAERGESTLRLQGGTNVQHAPSIDHVALVLKPNLDFFGLELRVDLERRGWFPVGGGRVSVTLSKKDATTTQMLDLSGAEADPVSLTGVVAGHRLPRTKVNSLLKALEKACATAFPSITTDITICPHSNFLQEDDDSKSRQKKRRKRDQPAVAIQLALTTSSGATIAADILKENSDDVDTVEDVVAALVDRAKNAGAGVDDQTADQLVVFMALRDGPTRLRCPAPSCQHLDTSIHFTTLLTGVPFTVVKGDGFVIIECPGSPRRDTTSAAVSCSAM